MTISPHSYPSPAALLRKHGMAPRKSWGQNFLHDPEVHAGIVRASRAQPGDRVVEIGAGLGSLTVHLLGTGAEVWAVERDRDMCAVLRAELGDQPNFTLHEADAVKFDYASTALGPERPATIVGNLPYQLTGVLLFALLDADLETGSWVVMVQREVADRLCSPPGSRQYGAASATIGRVRTVTKVLDVGRGAFLPPPRVESAVIRLDRRQAPLGEVRDVTEFRRLVRVAFQQRRKTLRNALGPLGAKEEIRRWCEVADVDPRVRPEKLGPEQFAALQRAREASDA